MFSGALGEDRESDHPSPAVIQLCDPANNLVLSLCNGESNKNIKGLLMTVCADSCEEFTTVSPME